MYYDRAGSILTQNRTVAENRTPAPISRDLSSPLTILSRLPPSVTLYFFILCVCVCAQFPMTENLPSPSPSIPSLRIFLLFAETEPSDPEHCLIIIPTLDMAHGWVKDVVAQFKLCGVCRERAPSTLRISRTLSVGIPEAIKLSDSLRFLSLLESSEVALSMLSGFVCCDDPECAEISQLRANTRYDRLACPTKVLSTPESVLKACSYCAKSREMAHTSFCSRCGLVRYCDASCQRGHWKFHKKKCVKQ